MGLFGYTNNSASLSNISLEYIDVTGNFLACGLVGSNSGTILNSYSTGNVSGFAWISGLVGYNDGTILNSYYIGNVGEARDNVGEARDYVGGLVGSNSGIILNSYSTGNVNGIGDYIGGLVGYNEGKITNSYSTESVDGSGDNVGGLVGNNEGTILNSYSTGNVRGNYEVGGLVGSNGSSTINSYSTGNVNGARDYVGGLVGVNYRIILNSYSTGNVNGARDYVGGLIGENIEGTVESSYYNSETSSQSDDDGRGSPRTTTEMIYPYDETSTTTYVGWDFDTIWYHDTTGITNNSYPYNIFIDIIPPVITILGSNPVSIYIGDSYTDSGATASDNVDGDITNSIVTTNTVNTSIVGSYTVTYNVSDTASNLATQVVRVVNVLNRPGGGGSYPFWPFNNNPLQQVLGEKTKEEKYFWTDGTYVKTNDKSDVYFLDRNNIRHAYPNQNIWKSYFNNDFSFVNTISKEELASYQLDKNVPYNINTLFKIPSIPKVYRVNNNRSISWIKTEELAKTLCGDNWNTLVQDLPDSSLSDYVLEEDRDNYELNNADKNIYENRQKQQ